MGELDVSNISRFREEALAAVAPGIDITVEMGDVTFLDSTAVSAFALVYRRARRLGGTVELVNVTTDVRRTLAMVGMDAAFGVRRPADEP